MSKPLRRPMFRMGGSPNTNSGIISGFAQPRQNYKKGDAVEKFRTESEDIMSGATYDVAEPKSGLSAADWLRIAAAGGEMLGAEGRGSGLKGTLAAVGPALSGLGKDLATSADSRTDAKTKYDMGRAAFDQSQRETQLGIAAAAYEGGAAQELQDSKVFKIDRQFEKYDEIEKGYIELSAQINSLDPSAGNYDSEFARLNNLITLSINKMYGALELNLPKDAVLGDLSQMTLNSQAETETLGALGLESVPLPNDPNYEKYSIEFFRRKKILFEQEKRILQGTDLSAEKKRVEEADGGRIGYANGSTMTTNTGPYEPGSGPNPDPGSPPVMQAQANTGSSPLSFEELRARLPREVSDDVIRLIATSEQALIDFAQIQTQEDIGRFNQRYNADLQLPAQVA